MDLFSLLSPLPDLGRLQSTLFPVLKLFVVPFGGGIPAGVMLAQTKGVAWPVLICLYIVSDMIMAVFYEPILRFLVAMGRKIPLAARIGTILQAGTARSVACYGGTGTGPLAFIMIAFGLDPITSRTMALAAGHGFLAGSTFAIIGDTLYFALIALSTLGLNSYIQDPNTTMFIVLGVMFIAPPLVRYLRSGRSALRF